MKHTPSAASNPLSHKNIVVAGLGGVGGFLGAACCRPQSPLRLLHAERQWPGGPAILE